MTVPTFKGLLPSLTTDQMIEVDRLMVEEYGIALAQMMENAGRCLAHLARERFLDKSPQGKQVVVLAGTGGNGGGAMVCARRLSGYGARVSVCVTKPPEDYRGVPADQLRILIRMGVDLIQFDDLRERDESSLIIDGVIGYSLRGAPRASAAAMIRWANQQSIPVLSLDTPSGVDTTSGEAYDPSIRATASMTLALPKKGLTSHNARVLVGELYLADIGVPPQLYAEASIGLEVGAVFAEGDIVRLY